MHSRTRASLLALILVAGAMPVDKAHAQLGRIRDRVRREAEEQIRRRTRDGAAAAAGQAAGAAAAAAAPEAFVNFDFVPGERVLFAEDFSEGTIGDFPRRLELIDGNGELAELGGRRYLRAAQNLTFAIPLPEALPRRYTVEIEYMAPLNSRVELYTGEGGQAAYNSGGKARLTFILGPGIANRAGLSTVDGRTAETALQPYQPHTPLPVRLMVDSTYVKAYMGGTRVSNAPNFDLGRSRKIVVRIDDLAGFQGAYISSIRVAAGGRDLYDALSSSGRVAVQGILFDTGSDRIRPESAPVLQRIGDMLTGHAELRLLVEGHTDDVGADAANLALSERRAAAVRRYLVERFGIAESRLESQGLGETRPAVPGTTPEARQQNRRVELVKI